MKYKIMYKCTMCGSEFHKGVVNINKKIQNHDYARTAMFFNDKMLQYKKQHPAHICTNFADKVVLQCGFGEFIGLQLDESEKEI